MMRIQSCILHRMVFTIASIEILLLVAALVGMSAAALLDSLHGRSRADRHRISAFIFQVDA